MENKIFKDNPTLEKYFETSDGQGFYTELNAKNHAKTLSDKSVKPVCRGVDNTDEDTEVKADAETKIDYRVALMAIKTATTIEELKPFETDERKSVKEAYTAKLAELATPAGNPAQEDTNTNNA